MKRRDLIIILTITFIGFIIGTLFDKQISSGIVVGNIPVVSLLVTGFGEYAASGTVAFIGTICVFYSLKNFKSILWKILFVAGGIVLVLLISYEQGDSLMDPDAFGPLLPEFFSKKYMLPVMGLVVVSPMIILGFIFKDKVNTENMFKILITIGAAIAVGLLISFLAKSVIHRPRYRIKETYGIDTLYTPWYDIISEEKMNGFINLGVDKNEFKSFPSGHASCSAYLVMVLPYLSIFFKILTKYKFELTYIGFLIAILISLSRVLQGAHYVSDVMFGMLISVIMCFIANEIIAKFFPLEESK